MVENENERNYLDSAEGEKKLHKGYKSLI